LKNVESVGTKIKVFEIYKDQLKMGKISHLIKFDKNIGVAF